MSATRTTSLKRTNAAFALRRMLSGVMNDKSSTKAGWLLKGVLPFPVMSCRGSKPRGILALNMEAMSLKIIILSASIAACASRASNAASTFSMCFLPNCL